MSRWLFGFAALLVFSCRPPAPGAVTLASPPAASVAPAPVPPRVAAAAAPCHADRACLERTAKDEPCDGSSPSLARLELAVDLVDGTHGPADIPRAREELASCFEDVAVQTVREHAAAKAREPKTPPFMSCDDFAQTTAATSECLAEHQEDETAWLRARAVPMDAETSRLFAAANAAFETYARATGAIAYAMFEGGTLRDPAMRNAIYTMTKRRRGLLAGAPLTLVDPDAEHGARAAWTDARKTATAEMRTAMDDAERAWPAYRDAEIAYFLRVGAGSRAPIATALDQAHTLDIREVTAP